MGSSLRLRGIVYRYRRRQNGRTALLSLADYLFEMRAMDTGDEKDPWSFPNMDAFR